MGYMTKMDSGLDRSSGRPSSGDWLAIRFLRRVAHPAHCSLPSDGNALNVNADSACAEQAFCSFLVAAQRTEGAREPYFAHPNSPLLTRDERRLLRALAAAQAGDEVLLDNYLYKFALGPLPRAQLAQAMRALAKSLSDPQHGSPSSTPRQLTVPLVAFGARSQGREQSDVPVA